MLPLDDELWPTLLGGYRSRFDASVPLKALLAGKDAADIWHLFWDELHHQGDVGDASYAAVPHLLKWLEQSQTLDWNPIAIIALIENCRWANNPQPRQEIADAYHRAIARAPQILVLHQDQQWSDTVTHASLWLIAAARGNKNFAKLFNVLDLNGAKDILNEAEHDWVDQ